MLIRAMDLEIPEDEPFSADKLERKKYAEPLTQLVANTPGPFVLAVDGGWGTGKTTFLRMWSQHLRNEGHRCLYFNAWKNDFAVDPLAALVAELAEDLEQGSPLSARSKKALRVLKELANTLSRRFASAAVASALYGLLSSRSPEESDENQQTLENLSNAAGEVASDAIGSYLQGRKDLERFRQQLAKLVEELDAGDPAKEPKKVVMFIDELDRCRPLYAVELLERVKHLFDVPGVTFVLGLDLTQLAHSVMAVNGGTFDATGYLKRFIDLRWSLPEPRIEGLRNLPALQAVIDLATRCWPNLKDQWILASSDLAYLFSVFGWSLRNQIQGLIRVNLALRAWPKASQPQPFVVMMGVFWYEWRPELFLGLFDKPGSADELYDALDEIIGFQQSTSPEHYFGDADDEEVHRARIESAILAAAAQLRSPLRALDNLDQEKNRDSKQNWLWERVGRLSMNRVGSRSDLVQLKNILEMTAAFDLKP